MARRFSTALAELFFPEQRIKVTVINGRHKIACGTPKGTGRLRSKERASFFWAAAKSSTRLNVQRRQDHAGGVPVCCLPTSPALTGGAFLFLRRCPISGGMKPLEDAELLIIGEIVREMARSRVTSFDLGEKGAFFARAAMINPSFMEQLVVVRRLLERRRTNPRRMLARVEPLFRELELDAERILQGW